MKKLTKVHIRQNSGYSVSFSRLYLHNMKKIEERKKSPKNPCLIGVIEFPCTVTCLYHFSELQTKLAKNKQRQTCSESIPL